MKKALIVTHYQKEDKAFKEDYSSIKIFIDGEKAAEWDDDYHDSGQDKAEGFIAGLKYCYPKLQVDKKNIADMEY